MVIVGVREPGSDAQVLTQYNGSLFAEEALANSRIKRSRGNNEREASMFQSACSPSILDTQVRCLPIATLQHGHLSTLISRSPVISLTGKSFSFSVFPSTNQISGTTLTRKNDLPRPGCVV